MSAMEMVNTITAMKTVHEKLMQTLAGCCPDFLNEFLMAKEQTYAE